MNELLRRLSNRLRYQWLGQEDIDRERIVGVGLSRTGTTSLCLAFEALGLRAIHYPPIAEVSDGAASLVWPWWMNAYDAFADIPAAATFRALAAKFPQARFVYTVRNEEDWLASCEKHFTERRFAEARMQPRYQQGLALNTLLYGASVFDRDLFRNAYRRHDEAVRDFFGDTGRALTLNIAAGEGYEKLCPFLGRAMIEKPFPKANIRADKDGPTHRER